MLGVVRVESSRDVVHLNGESSRIDVQSARRKQMWCSAELMLVAGFCFVWVPSRLLNSKQNRKWVSRWPIISDAVERSTNKIQFRKLLHTDFFFGTASVFNYERLGSFNISACQPWWSRSLWESNFPEMDLSIPHIILYVLRQRYKTMFWGSYLFISFLFLQKITYLAKFILIRE